MSAAIHVYMCYTYVTCGFAFRSQKIRLYTCIPQGVRLRRVISGNFGFQYI